MITKLARIALVLVVAVAMSSCNDGEYIVRDNLVLYSYWTFSFGTRTDTLPGADPATFKTIKNWLARDAHNVYFKSSRINGADPATIKSKKFPLSCDAHDYYYEDKALHVAHRRST